MDSYAKQQTGCLLVMAGLLSGSLLITIVYSGSLGVGLTILLCLAEIIVLLVLTALFMLGFAGARDSSERTVIDLSGGRVPGLQREAQQPLLDPELEATAQQLRRLLSQFRTWDDSAHQEIRRIGLELNAKGGFTLMQQVSYRVVALGGAGDAISACWHEIGQWRA